MAVAISVTIPPAYRQKIQSPFFLWSSVAAVLFLLLLQAHFPWWRTHLQADVGAFYNRSAYFFPHGSWQGMGYDEYQPGALIYFVLIGFLSFAPGSFDAFITMTIMMNVLLIIAHVLFFLRTGPKWAPLTFVLLTAAAGPILLFRFELLVSLVVLWAWRLFQRKQLFFAAFLLGIATSIKLYPLIVLPLVAGELLRKKKWADTVMVIGCFSAGVAFPIVLTVAYGFSFLAILQSVAVHGLKPVGLEGFWGNLVTIVQGLLHIPLDMTPGYGVQGFTPTLWFFSIPLLNTIWVIPTGFLLLGIFWTRRNDGYADPICCFLLLFSFVYFEKVVNPQYLWWFLSLLPLLAPPQIGKRRWLWCVALAAGSLLFTQLLYPLYYTQFIAWFYGQTANGWLFFLMVVRNILLALLGALCLSVPARKNRHVRSV